MSTNKFLSQVGFAYFVEKLKLLLGDLNGKTVASYVTDAIQGKADSSTVTELVNKLNGVDDNVPTFVQKAIGGLKLADNYAPKSEFDALKGTVDGIGNVDEKITEALKGEYSLKKVVRIAKNAGNTNTKVAELIAFNGADESKVNEASTGLDFTSKSYVAYVIADADGNNPRLSFSEDPDVVIPEVSTVTKGEINVILRKLDKQLYPEETHPNVAEFAN